MKYNLYYKTYKVLKACKFLFNNVHIVIYTNKQKTIFVCLEQRKAFDKCIDQINDIDQNLIRPSRKPSMGFGTRINILAFNKTGANTKCYKVYIDMNMFLAYLLVLLPLPQMSFFYKDIFVLFLASLSKTR